MKKLLLSLLVLVAFTSAKPEGATVDKSHDWVYNLEKPVIKPVKVTSDPFTMHYFRLNSVYRDIEYGASWSAKPYERKLHIMVTMANGPSFGSFRTIAANTYGRAESIANFSYYPTAYIVSYSAVLYKEEF